ncbi:helix-turn-helix domain-containing protein [Oleispirillum naphthae]|uniref:helix-turn-helix domain-containing protein n=1 Tax=Oleispirillum naphthae TaxID=2838853 RepID=UPI0030823663
MVSGLAEALGRDYCIVLYALAGAGGAARAVAVANGGVAGLAEGSAALAADAAAISEICRPGAAASLQYFSVSSGGRRLRSTLARVAGAGGAGAVFLAVHYDLSRAEQLQALVAQLTGGAAPAEEEAEAPASAAPPSVNALVEQGLQRVRRHLGKPLSYAGKVEKIQAVEWLDREGFFLFKGAVEALAQEMGNTKYTIYAYLRETRMRSAD